MRRLTALTVVVCILLAATVSVVASATETATLTLYPGENWIAPPLVALDANPTAVFAGLSINGNLTRFDAFNQQVVTYNSANPASFGNILLGDGYKINYSGQNPFTLSYVGVPDGVPDSQGNMTDMWIALPGNMADSQNSGGTHWIGQPYNHNTSVGSMMVTNNVELITVLNAVNRGWLDPLWHGFNAETQTGFTVGLSAYGANQNYFKAGQTYEIVSHIDNLALIVPATPYVPEPSSILVLTCGFGWLLRCKRRMR
ncbi:MAG: PEP-CTERM sorting domain-containing protein [Armatimonadota bacterium]